MNESAEETDDIHQGQARLYRLISEVAVAHIKTVDLLLLKLSRTAPSDRQAVEALAGQAERILEAARKEVSMIEDEVGV